MSPSDRHLALKTRAKRIVGDLFEGPAGFLLELNEAGGHIVFEGTPGDLEKNDAVRREWLEV